jgi:two-component system, sensor histidine kinase and response regulator
MKILIVEDDASIREILQDLLEINGHTVTAAADGQAGIDLAQLGPELILCDIGLPDKNGFEVLAALRQIETCREIPFIFLTARADRDDQRRGMALGADDYITKPFTQRDITEAIAARIQRQQPLRARVAQLLAERRTEIGANWSHELLTPLNGVLGGLALIEAEADTIKPNQLRELLALIRDGAERQFTFSRKLILFYELERLKTNPSKYPLGRCEADEIIYAAANPADHPAIRPSDLNVSCGVAAIAATSSHLTAALSEIIENAFRFSRPGDRVNVSGNRHGHRYHIVVTDHGPGLTAEQRAHLAPFTQFDRGRQEQQGLGLGLAIARLAAESVGGELRVEATGPGERGLKVTFDLPSL